MVHFNRGYMIPCCSQVPNVKWEDIGGLEDAKQAIIDTVRVATAESEKLTGHS
jgi:SpoVK/Ycf46/Vps4 family AAA+-type ATPase